MRERDPQQAPVWGVLDGSGAPLAHPSWIKIKFKHRTRNHCSRSSKRSGRQPSWLGLEQRTWLSQLENLNKKTKYLFCESHLEGNAFEEVVIKLFSRAGPTSNGRSCDRQRVVSSGKDAPRQLTSWWQACRVLERMRFEREEEL